MTPSTKRCFIGLTATFGLKEVSLKSIFKALGRKILFYACVARLIPKRRHAVAADKNCIPINTHESRFSKNTEKHLFRKVI